MPDKVIRLGGSNIAQSIPVENLKNYLNPEDRNFVVFSAVPEIYALIEKSLTHVFEINHQDHSFEDQLTTIWKTITGEKPSAEYSLLTSQLINIFNGIALIGDYSLALRDQVLSYSEGLTSELLKYLWGSQASVLTPANIDLRVTSDYGNATFISVNTNALDKVKPGINFVPGSYGITESGKIARAGKAAADYTAAFLTKAVGCGSLELWGLDHDFQRADPAIVANPPKISRLTYSEASELAYFDHYSFHPRTVEPLEHLHVPVHVINIETTSADTVINTETWVEEQIVKSVACTDDISLLKLDGPGVGLKPGILAKVTSKLNEAGINIKSVITSQISINLILGSQSGEKALELIRQTGFTSVREISLVSDVSLIGIIGHGMRQNYGVSAKIFNAVAQNKINVLLSGSGASDLVSYLVVQRSDKEKSVREIYHAFFNENL